MIDDLEDTLPQTSPRQSEFKALASSPLSNTTSGSRHGDTDSELAQSPATSQSSPRLRRSSSFGTIQNVLAAMSVLQPQSRASRSEHSATMRSGAKDAGPSDSSLVAPRDESEASPSPADTQMAPHCKRQNGRQRPTRPPPSAYHFDEATGANHKTKRRRAGKPIPSTALAVHGKEKEASVHPTIFIVSPKNGSSSSISTLEQSVGSEDCGSANVEATSSSSAIATPHLDRSSHSAHQRGERSINSPMTSDDCEVAPRINGCYGASTQQSSYHSGSTSLGKEASEGRSPPLPSPSNQKIGDSTQNNDSSTAQPKSIVLPKAGANRADSLATARGKSQRRLFGPLRKRSSFNILASKSDSQDHSEEHQIKPCAPNQAGSNIQSPLSSGKSALSPPTSPAELAAQLDELAVSHGENLISADDYRILRQRLFQQTVQASRARSQYSRAGSYRSQGLSGMDVNVHGGAIAFDRLGEREQSDHVPLQQLAAAPAIPATQPRRRHSSKVSSIFHTRGGQETRMSSAKMFGPAKQMQATSGSAPSAWKPNLASSSRLPAQTGQSRSLLASGASTFSQIAPARGTSISSKRSESIKGRQSPSLKAVTAASRSQHSGNDADETRTTASHGSQARFRTLRRRFSSGSDAKPAAMAEMERHVAESRRSKHLPNRQAGGESQGGVSRPNTATSSATSASIRFAPLGTTRASLRQNGSSSSMQERERAKSLPRSASQTAWSEHGHSGHPTETRSAHDIPPTPQASAAMTAEAALAAGFDTSDYLYSTKASEEIEAEIHIVEVEGGKLIRAFDDLENQVWSQVAADKALADSFALLGGGGGGDAVNAVASNLKHAKANITLLSSQSKQKRSTSLKEKTRLRGPASNDRVRHTSPRPLQKSESAMETGRMASKHEAPAPNSPLRATADDTGPSVNAVNAYSTRIDEIRRRRNDVAQRYDDRLRFLAGKARSAAIRESLR
ncbi:unnamed protein product [Jaminaea pallidilutea]